MRNTEGTAGLDEVKPAPGQGTIAPSQFGSRLKGRRLEGTLGVARGCSSSADSGGGVEATPGNS